MTCASRVIVNAFGLLLLFTCGVTAQQQEQFPVIDAVDKGHGVGREQDGIQAVRAALLAGGDLNERDSHGWTPLMQAGLQCRAKIVTLLIDNSANVNLRGNSGGDSFGDSG